MSKKVKKKKSKVAKKTKKVVKKVTKKVTKKAVKKKSKKSSTKTGKAAKMKVTAKKKPAKKASSRKIQPKKTIGESASSKSGAIVLQPKTAGLNIGQAVPDMELPSTDGMFSFSKYKGKNIVLYFYPKDHTPGCTLEGHDFSSNLDQFVNKNTVVFGVSKDSVNSHKSFIQKQNYKHHLISDESEKLCQAFGVIKEKNMYGRMYLGIERSTFIINSLGVVVAAWRGVKVNGHVQEVLAKLEA